MTSLSDLSLLRLSKPLTITAPDFNLFNKVIRPPHRRDIYEQVRGIVELSEIDLMSSSPDQEMINGRLRAIGTLIVENYLEPGNPFTTAEERERVIAGLSRALSRVDGIEASQVRELLQQAVQDWKSMRIYESWERSTGILPPEGQAAAHEVGRRYRLALDLVGTLVVRDKTEVR